MPALFIELVELVLQRLFVGGWVPASERIGNDIVHMEGVGHGHEVPAFQRYDEGLVPARLVDMVGEAETLQNIEGMRGIAHPVGVPADRRLPRRLLDAGDAVRDEATLSLGIERIAVGPG